MPPAQLQSTNTGRKRYRMRSPGQLGSICDQRDAGTVIPSPRPLGYSAANADPNRSSSRDMTRPRSKRGAYGVRPGEQGPTGGGSSGGAQGSRADAPSALRCHDSGLVKV